MQMGKFEIVSSGSWPASDYVSVALIPVTSETLSRVVGTRLAHGVEIGLGAWEAVGLRLESGALVELISYTAKPGPPAFELRVAGDADLLATLQQVLALLGVSSQSLPWVCPGVHA